MSNSRCAGRRNSERRNCPYCEVWHHFCSFSVAVHRVSIKCAKMERSMTKHHRFVFGEDQRGLTEFQIDATCRLVRQIEAVITDFNRSVSDLNRAIEAEQVRTGIADPNHFAYSTAAQAMIRRRSNLIQSIDRLKRQLAAATTTNTTSSQTVLIEPARSR
jgi:hypothetical protein